MLTSSSTFTVDGNVTLVGTVTATDIQAVTFTISNSGSDDLTITSAGILSFITAPDYESQSADSRNRGLCLMAYYEHNSNSYSN